MMKKLVSSYKIVFLVGFTFLIGCEFKEKPQTPKVTSENQPLPNIVFILADDLGNGDVEFLNPESKIPTPHLNRLAWEGKSFLNAHSEAAVCTPSRYSFLTGRFSWRSRQKKGVTWIWDPPLIESNRLTIGKMLQQKGYHTACIGKWHLGWNWPTKDGQPATLNNKGKNVDYSQNITDGPITRGFDYYFGDDVPSFPPHAFIQNDTMLVNPSAWLFPGNGVAEGAMAPGWRYEDLLPSLTKKAKEYIINRTVAHSEHPFFLYFSLSAPHTPIAPNKKFVGKTDAGPYGDFVYELDHYVGEIIRTLDSLHINENTLVIFTSDNGPTNQDGNNYTGAIGSLLNYDHNSSGYLRGIKSDAWEGGHRVPFIAKWAGHIEKGTTSKELLSQTDMMATFATLVNIDLPDSTAEDSHNQLPLFLGDGKSQRNVETLVTQSGNGILAIQQGKWKMILSSGGGGSWTQPKGKVAWVKHFSQKLVWTNIQLYNLGNDEKEQNNLARNYPKKVDELGKLLAKYIAEGRSTPGLPQTNDGEPLWEEVEWSKAANLY